MEEISELELKKEYIKQQAVFAKLSEEESTELASLLHRKHFKTGETIVTEGDPVDSVYLIISGTADVRHVLIQDHQPVIESLATLNHGDAIGLNESGFYSVSGIRTATVVALTEMETFRLSVAAFHGFALSNHRVSEIMRVSASKILGYGGNV